jgi:curved DNA-binding protein CbpA
MNLDSGLEKTSYYDILDLAPSANPQEIREAYLRVKSAYNKDSVALYSLITPEEREEILRKVEQAYEVLSHPEQRREYDRGHRPAAAPMDLFSDSLSNVVSIDRVPPMEANHGGEDLLIAPATDFTQGQSIPNQAAGLSAESLPAASLTDPNESPELPRRSTKGAEASLAREILDETEWRGDFLKRVRDSRRISLEEMAGMTKVSKTYLLAIEEENYPKLPAAVFLRGFITQIAKILKLPHEQVTISYMNRYFASKQGPSR